jgi:hypothetical protein
MNNQFKPTASDRKEKKVTNQFNLHSVDISGVTENSWKELVGKEIFFWSWTIGRINETARTKTFIFHTKANFGFYKVQKLLKEKYPDWDISRWTLFGRDVGIQIPYGVSHAIEIRVKEPTPWLDLMEKTTSTLEPAIRLEQSGRVEQ